MKPNFVPAALALAAAAMAPAAFAQSPVVSDEDITVTGRREALTSTLQAVLSETGFGQLGRFEQPVCPGVSGLPENYGAVVVGLIRANAEAAGVRLAEEGCRPNANLVFVSDPRALILGWSQRDPTLFGTRTPSEIAALADRPGPAVSWRVTETMRHDGVRPERVESVDGGNGATLTGRDTLLIRNALSSRNEENVRQDIQLSFVVIDSDAIRGKSLQQLADFATLHLLLDLSADAGERAGPHSILSLFGERPAGRPAPAQLSAFDRGMLAGLYRPLRNNFSSHRQRGQIVRQIQQEAGAAD